MELQIETGHEQIESTVDRVRTRVRLLRMQDWMVLGLLAAVALGALLALATRLQWWTDAVDYVLWFLLAGAAAGAAAGWFRHVSRYDAARLADERAGLQERLSTAIHILDQQKSSPLARAQLADAARASQALQAAQLLPYRAPRRWPWLLGAAALLLGFIFLPEWGVFLSSQEKQDREAMRAEGRKIQRVARDLEKAADKRKSEEEGRVMKQLSRTMHRLGRDQERSRISKKQAMLKMEDLQQKLREVEAQRQAGRAGKQRAAAEDLRRAAEESRKAGGSERAAAMEKMADSLERGDMKAAAQQLQKISERLDQGKASAGDMKQAAADLEKIAGALENSGEKAAASEVRKAAGEMEQAASRQQELQKAAEKASTPEERQKLERQMSQNQISAMRKAQGSASKACQSCGSSSSSSEESETGQASQALKSAQQALAQAGQGGEPQGGGGASSAEMGQEFKPSGQSASGTGGGNNSGPPGRPAPGSGGGMGGPGRGMGGNAGAQQPLPGKKRDVLVRGVDDPKGQRLQRTYTGAPDPNQDRAAYFTIVPERARAAEAALDREEIPAPFKKGVRDYFTGIQRGAP